MISMGMFELLGLRSVDFLRENVQEKNHQMICPAKGGRGPKLNRPE